MVVEGVPGELADVLPIRPGRGYRSGELVELLAEHGPEQRPLVAEVVVQAFFVDPGPFGDAGHGGAVEAALGELHGRRFLEAATGALGVPAMHRRRGVHRTGGRQYPGGRVGQPEDIVGLAAFLCSDAASHLSGTVITVRPPVYR